MLIEGILKNFDALEKMRNECHTGSIIALDKDDIDPILLSDVYIDITRAFNEVVLTEEEEMILSLIIYGYAYSEIARMTKLDRQEVATRFGDICHKFIEILGGDYETEL